VPRPTLADERGIIVGFFLKILLGLLVAALILADGTAIFFAHLRADDAATAGATQCAFQYKRTRGNYEQAQAAGAEAANKKAPGMDRVAVQPNQLNGECTVIVEEEATTILVGRIGFLDHLGEAEASETAGAPSF
jgi:hypothetical protein